MDFETLTRPEDAGLSSRGLAAIDEAVAAYIDKGLLSGAVTIAGRHGRVVHVHPMGKMDIASGAPMKADTLFRDRKSVV